MSTQALGTTTVGTRTYVRNLDGTISTFVATVRKGWAAGEW